jgi:hypothetical protein
MASKTPREALALAQLSPAAKRRAKCQGLIVEYADKHAVRTPLPKIEARRDPETGALDLVLPGDPTDKIMAKAILSKTCGTTHEDLWKQIIGNAVLGLKPEQGEEQALVNVLIATMLEFEPNDPVEAMLISQVVILHRLAMRRLAAAAKERDPEISLYRQNLAAKYLRLFRGQLQTFIRYRGGNKPQRIIVKHVHVHQGGQAVIAGNVTSKR